MEKNKEELVHLGFAAKPHGIKGGFQFKLFNESESVLSKNAIITLKPKAGSTLKVEGEQYQIENIHFNNKVICYLKDIQDRNQVEAMLPFDIYFPRSLFPKLAADEVYVRDLIGLKVISPTGEELGEVVTQYDNGAQIVLKLKLKHHSLELPFVKEFFPTIDLENSTLTFIEPEVLE